MKHPNQVRKTKINNQEYEIKFFYSNAKHVYLTYEDGAFLVRGSIINLLNSRFENFLNKAMLNILKKLSLKSKPKLEIDTLNKKIYYFGNLLNYQIKNNLIYLIDAKNNIIKKFKKSNNDKFDDAFLIKNFLKKELLSKFDFFAKEAANSILKKNLDFKYSLRDKKTSWASITVASQKINICSDLIYFSDEIIKYVAYHEICHIIHHNHSKEFWSLLKKYIPNYQELKNKLKNHIFK
ncbi:M48 family metallopeptidase [Metamycoplasma alkalescens]|uniref:YgjP-like metallopeptidase domain-containing protein n=2 Tax=Metamycoplasma alkalescens TaxID=45363 RepID=A0A318U7T6_9BACT|nr:M48 family metallopeptidase [Metamycoplasma alkalescens]PYF43115.1 hypothetical protein BCF88_10539 [Metamycoplasma alkalescens]